MSFASSVGSLDSGKKSVKTPDSRNSAMLSSKSAHKTLTARSSPTSHPSDENASYLANAQQSRLTYKKSTPSMSSRGRSPSNSVATPPLHPSRSSSERETSRSNSSSRGRSPATITRKLGSRLSSRSPSTSRRLSSSPSTSRRSFDAESIYDSWSFIQKRTIMKSEMDNRQPEYSVGLAIRAMNAIEISTNSKRIISIASGSENGGYEHDSQSSVSIVKPHLFEEASSPGAVAAAAHLYNQQDWSNSFTFDQVFNLNEMHSSSIIHGRRDSHQIHEQPYHPHYMQTTIAAEHSNVSTEEKKKVHGQLISEHEVRLAHHDDLTLAAQRHSEDLKQQVKNIQTIQPQHHSHPTVNTMYHSASNGPDHYSHVMRKETPKVINVDEVDNKDTEQMFKQIGQPLIETCMKGRHSSYFSYGHEYDDNVFRKNVLCSLMARIASDEQTKSDSMVHLSIYRIENEKVVDLLEYNNKTEKAVYLKVREHPRVGAQIVGLKKVHIQNETEIHDALRKAKIRSHHFHSRHHDTASHHSHHHTGHGSHSSPSSKDIKATYVTTLTISPRIKSTDMYSYPSVTCNLVSLSQNQACMSTFSAVVTGIRSLNSSTSTLTRDSNSTASTMSVNELTVEERERGGEKEKVLPYRESLLTWLLKDALHSTGNRVTILASISPAACAYDQSLKILKTAASLRTSHPNHNSHSRTSTPVKGPMASGETGLSTTSDAVSILEGHDNPDASTLNNDNTTASFEARIASIRNSLGADIKGSSAARLLYEESIADPQQRINKMLTKSAQKADRASRDVQSLAHMTAYLNNNGGEGVYESPLNGNIHNNDDNDNDGDDVDVDGEIAKMALQRKEKDPLVNLLGLQSHSPYSECSAASSPSLYKPLNHSLPKLPVDQKSVNHMDSKDSELDASVWRDRFLNLKSNFTALQIELEAVYAEKRTLQVDLDAYHMAEAAQSNGGGGGSGSTSDHRRSINGDGLFSNTYNNEVVELKNSLDKEMGVNRKLNMQMIEADNILQRKQDLIESLQQSLGQEQHKSEKLQNEAEKRIQELLDRIKDLENSANAVDTHRNINDGKAVEGICDAASDGNSNGADNTTVISKLEGLLHQSRQDLHHRETVLMERDEELEITKRDCTLLARELQNVQEKLKHQDNIMSLYAYHNNNHPNTDHSKGSHTDQKNTSPGSTAKQASEVNKQLLHELQEAREQLTKQEEMLVLLKQSQLTLDRLKSEYNLLVSEKTALADMVKAQESALSLKDTHVESRLSESSTVIHQLTEELSTLRKEHSVLKEQCLALVNERDGTLVKLETMENFELAYNNLKEQYDISSIDRLQAELAVKGNEVQGLKKVVKQQEKTLAAYQLQNQHSKVKQMAVDNNEQSDDMDSMLDASRDVLNSSHASIAMQEGQEGQEVIKSAEMMSIIHAIRSKAASEVAQLKSDLELKEIEIARQNKEVVYYRAVSEKQRQYITAVEHSNNTVQPTSSEVEAQLREKEEENARLRKDMSAAKQVMEKEYAALWVAVEGLHRIDAVKEKEIQTLILENQKNLKKLDSTTRQFHELEQELKEIDTDLLETAAEEGIDFHTPVLHSRMKQKHLEHSQASIDRHTMKSTPYTPEAFLHTNHSTKNSQVRREESSDAHGHGYDQIMSAERHRSDSDEERALHSSLIELDQALHYRK